MENKKLDDLIIQIENYLECWKQFNHYLSLARTKKFAQEDENQFLEIKSVLAQELEMIISGIEFTNPSKDEVHGLLGGATSYFAYAYWNRKSLSARSLSTDEWPTTAELRGTAKSKLLVGWTRPPVVMIGRYSSSAP